MNFDKIRTCLIAELDTRKRQIEAGQYTWFSVKVLQTRSGAAVAIFQSEEVCPIEQSREEMKLFVNSANGANNRHG